MQPELNVQFVTVAVADTIHQIYTLASLSIGGVALRDAASILPSIDEGLIELMKTFSLLFSLVCVAGITWVLIRTRMLSAPTAPAAVDELMPPAPAPTGPWVARWEEVMRHMDSAKEQSWKFAVIEADALVDRVLMKSGFPGATLGERLMNIQPGQLASLEGLWAAHKVRNKVAHQPDYFLRYSEAQWAISWYGATLRELLAL
ncbi:MAG: hypothetical protein AAB864_01570 [Patescibacteria group bacterium]